MPKRDDLNSIMIIGAGPIVIGQACEFDYSGTQACKALREEGYRVILVNSNPATIMTDPETADATYIEPITPEVVEKILEREKPDAVLPTLGGQTGLNTALALHDRGVFERLGIEMLGADADVIRKAEDRDLFRAAMQRAGLAALLQIPLDTALCVGTLDKANLAMAVSARMSVRARRAGLAFRTYDALGTNLFVIGVPCVTVGELILKGDDVPHGVGPVSSAISISDSTEES